MFVYVCLEYHEDKRSFEGHWDPVIIMTNEKDADEWMNNENRENRDYRKFEMKADKIYFVFETSEARNSLFKFKDKIKSVSFDKPKNENTKIVEISIGGKNEN